MILLTIKPFYIIVLLLILVCFLDIIFQMLIYPLFKQTTIKKAILEAARKYNCDCTLIKEKTCGTNFILKVEQKKYFIKILYTKKNCDLQINNKDTFMMYIKATSDSMKTKKINNLTSFMNYPKENKVIVLASKAKTIKKVINECEMIMVNEETDVYGVHILNTNQYDYFFKNIK